MPEPRRFRHLKKAEIAQIIALHIQQVPNRDIAIQIACDISTVRYHITRHENGHRPLITTPSPNVCTHPSLKCLLCGRALDYLRRQEREQIRHLTEKLAKANAILTQHDLMTVE